MGFDKFGTVSFTDESKAVDFVTYLEQGKVMATRCKRCDTRYFPPKMDCPNCLGDDIEWFQIEDSGKLATYTEVNYGPTGFEEDTPYTLAIVDFEEAEDSNEGQKLAEKYDYTSFHDFKKDIEGMVLYGVYQIISEDFSGEELVIRFSVPEVGQGRGLFRIEQNGLKMGVREFPYPKANYVALYVDDRLEPE